MAINIQPTFKTIFSSNHSGETSPESTSVRPLDTAEACAVFHAKRASRFAAKTIGHPGQGTPPKKN